MLILPLLEYRQSARLFGRTDRSECEVGWCPFINGYLLNNTPWCALCKKKNQRAFFHLQFCTIQFVCSYPNFIPRDSSAALFHPYLVITRLRRLLPAPGANIPAGGAAPTPSLFSSKGWEQEKHSSRPSIHKPFHPSPLHSSHAQTLARRTRSPLGNNEIDTRETATSERERGATGTVNCAIGLECVDQTRFPPITVR